MTEWMDMGALMLVAIGLAAFVTASIHGATGIAGGFLMAAFLAPIIGVKPVLPVMSIALLISHSSRAIMNMQSIDMRAVLLVIIPALPMMILATIVYGRLDARWLAIVVGLIILASVPVRHWAKAQDLQTTPPMLASAGAGYGVLAGIAVGPGLMLVPFLMGFGLGRQAFVASLAMIALLTNLVRGASFGVLDLVDMQTITLGLFIGVITIPGNWFGKTILKRMTDSLHGRLVDVLMIIAGLNFLWLAL